MLGQYFTLLISAFFFIGKMAAQDSLSSLNLWQWREVLPWQRATFTAQSTDKVWFASESAILELEKQSRERRFITKVEGLSDVGIAFVRYNRSAERLLVAYTNSNLDLYDPTNGKVTNLPFIRKNPNIIGNRKLYDAVFEGKSAYLACGFGMVKMDLSSTNVAYTVFTGMPVYACALYKNTLYIGTEDGVFSIPENDINPADFSRWKAVGTDQGIPIGSPVVAMTTWRDNLYIGIGNNVYRFDGSNAIVAANNPDRPLLFLSAEGEGLLVCWKKDFNGNIDYYDTNFNRFDLTYPCDVRYPLHAIEDGSKKFWIADLTEDYRFMDMAKNSCERFRFNSPFEENYVEVYVGPRRVLLGTPATNANLEPLGDQNRGAELFMDGRWSRFNRETFPEIEPFDYRKDMWRVIEHPKLDKYYIGSFSGGLIEVTDGTKVKGYNKDNSILQGAGESGPDRTAISGLAYDKSDNLWICNYGANAPIAVLKADGSWRNYAAAPARNLLQAVVDNNQYKWFTVGFNGGVLVFDSGRDIDNTSDDRYRLINTANSVLPTNTVSTIAVDLDGDVWVGTIQGVVSFECGTNIFDGSCTGRRRIVTVDGFNGYLLETEEVRAIAIDGANRKWFGTNNGIFVQSPDGTEQVARFTSTNSPLFDNSIVDIAINQQNGEVWIATEKGLQIIRTDATVGGKVNSTMPYAYPNPVQPDYDGPIAIYGLARDANVKITDISGQLVYEGKALGGQAVWNGRDYLGRRVASGVYLVYATSSETFDSPDAIITKVVVLN